MAATSRIRKKRAKSVHIDQAFFNLDAESFQAFNA